MIKNILKNGEVVDDMSKITVPVNGQTIRAYDLIIAYKPRKDNNARETNRE